VGKEGGKTREEKGQVRPSFSHSRRSFGFLYDDNDEDDDVEEKDDACHVPMKSVDCTGQLGGNYVRVSVGPSQLCYNFML
jgi:hypothetical protein